MEITGNATAKTYAYNYDEYETEGKGPETMVADILSDPGFLQVTDLSIGNWGAWETGCQPIIDQIVEQASHFSHIQKLFIGDMDYEECEVSWIMQGNYSKLWAALPNLREMTIKGSVDLDLGEISHPGLESLTIICGGLPKDVIASIQKAKLPNLKKLLLYIGIEDYGFDGNANTIKELLEQADFPKLTYLGIVDSEIQDELTEIVLSCKYMGQIDTLDLSMGTLTDQGGALLLEKIPAWKNIQKLDLHYHYLSPEMAKKLKSLPITVDVEEGNEAEEYDGEIYRNAMLTE